MSSLDKITEQLPIKDVYDDAFKPVAQETGNLIGLIPKTIRAALSPIEIWIKKREYAIQETEKFLKKKLECYDASQICTPEPYIAVPTIEAISYSKDCKQIREMYANLLAKSMIYKERDYVHPAFIEIIKQLTPDEAKIINYLLIYGDRQPVLEVRRLNRKLSSNESVRDFVRNCIIIKVDQKSNLQLVKPDEIIHYYCGLGYTFLRNISTIAYYANCSFPNRIESYIDNLVRLKIINVNYASYLDKDDEYISIALSKHVKNSILNDYNHQEKSDSLSYHLKKGYICFSDFGREFVKICFDEDDAEDIINDDKYSKTANPPNI